MAVAAACSLVLPSFSPTAGCFSALKPTRLSPLALNLHLKSLSASTLLWPLDVAPRAAAASTSSIVSSCPPISTRSKGKRGGFLSKDEGRAFSPDLKLFVGNLPFNVDSAQLAGLFESIGNVEMVKVIYDKDTGRSRGFGFVSYDSADEVNNAIVSLNGVDLNGRAIRVTHAEAKPRRQF